MLYATLHIRRCKRHYPGGRLQDIHYPNIGTLITCVLRAIVLLMHALRTHPRRRASARPRTKPRDDAADDARPKMARQTGPGRQGKVPPPVRGLRFFGPSTTAPPPLPPSPTPLTKEVGSWRLEVGVWTLGGWKLDSGPLEVGRWRVGGWTLDPWRLDVGGWELDSGALEVGSWRLEVGLWTPGSWKLDSGALEVPAGPSEDPKR